MRAFWNDETINIFFLSCFIFSFVISGEITKFMSLYWENVIYVQKPVEEKGNSNLHIFIDHFEFIIPLFFLIQRTHLYNEKENKNKLVRIKDGRCEQSASIWSFEIFH